LRKITKKGFFFSAHAQLFQGKLIFTIPYFGYIGYFVRTPIGFILLIILPASLIIILEIRNIIKELKNKNKNQKTSKEPRKNGD
jgi:signal peptidase